MSNTDLKLNPFPLTSDRGPTEQAWYYEDNDGLHIVVRSRDEDGWTGYTDIFKIPWRKLRGHLKRKDK